MSEKKIDGFTIEEIAECNDFLDKRVQEIHEEKQQLLRNITHFAQYIAFLEEAAEFHAGKTGEDFSVNEEREKFLTAEQIEFLFD